MFNDCNLQHYGIAGYYATMATDQGWYVFNMEPFQIINHNLLLNSYHTTLCSIGLTGTNARPSIAPTFGVEPMMGTNPLTWGLPSSDPFPFVIDCATSVNQRGKIEKYAREGVDTPRGAVIDDQGIERTDTEGILRDMVLGKCALTPLGGAGDAMGGYKGMLLIWLVMLHILHLNHV